MKTTIELPDTLFRHAKMLAVRRGTTMRELVIEGLKRIVDNHVGSVESGFVLTKEEAEVVTIGANGLPVLKRTAVTRKKPVTDKLVNQIREELSI